MQSDGSCGCIDVPNALRGGRRGCTPAARPPHAACASGGEEAAHERHGSEPRASLEERCFGLFLLCCVGCERLAPPSGPFGASRAPMNALHPELLEVIASHLPLPMVIRLRRAGVRIPVSDEEAWAGREFGKATPLPIIRSAALARGYARAFDLTEGWVRLLGLRANIRHTLFHPTPVDDELLELLADALVWLAEQAARQGPHRLHCVPWLDSTWCDPGMTERLPQLVEKWIDTGSARLTTAGVGLLGWMPPNADACARMPELVVCLETVRSHPRAVAHGVMLAIWDCIGIIDPGLPSPAGIEALRLCLTDDADPLLRWRAHRSGVRSR